MQHMKLLLATILSITAISGCEDFDGPMAPPPSEPRREEGEPYPEPTPTSDDVYASVARKEVPGFAGFYLLDDGTPVIRLTDPAQSGAALDFLATELKDMQQGAHAEAFPEPVIMDARYDFAELKQWADSLDTLLDRDGMYTLDVDEVENRVHMGVRDEEAIRAVREHAEKAGVPQEALAVDVQAAPEERQTVQGWANPLIGGHQISNGAGLCTLGFNAWWNGGWIFVTNSHCTPRYFASDGGTIWQPTAVAGNQVGWEVRDRGRYACNGWISFFITCRRADAAYIRNNGWRGVGQGQIARTPWNMGAPGGLNVIGAFDIVSRYSGATPVGMWLDKTGRTSGSTYGRVTNSCVSIGSLRCQDISTVWSQPGDSGSPIHFWIGGNQTRLQGILWGGPSGNWNVTYSSRLSGIEQDLGGLSGLCRPGFGC